MQNNLPIPPGVFFGMPDEQYHGTDAVSSGFLKTFARSPLHAWAAYVDPERVRKDKKAWRIGRAWHCALFEPSHFGDRYAAGHDAHPSTKQALLLQRMLAREVTADKLRVLPDGLSLTTKEGKALVAEIEAVGEVPVSSEHYEWLCRWFPRLDGRDVLPESAITDVQRMAGIARALPVSRVIFDSMGAYGAAEVSMFGECPATGLPLRIRADYMLAPCPAFPSGLIVDGKSTQDASPEGFGRQVWNLDYGLQAAFYTRVFAQVWGRGRPKFVWLAQEKEAPYAAKFYGAGDDLVAYWDRALDLMLPVVAECRRTGVWPGYGDQVQDLALPDWAQKRLEGSNG